MQQETEQPQVKQLGEVLVEEGLITPEQLERAQGEQERRQRSLGRVLIELGLMTESNLVAALAKRVGLEFIELTDTRIDGSAAALIPESLAKRYVALPIALEEDGRLIVAMSDPSNVYAIDDIRTLTGREVKPVVATRSDILATISRVQRMEGSI
ncbi:MAG: type II secretion system protein GspE, partial [Actinomycetota bacterium]